MQNELPHRKNQSQFQLGLGPISSKMFYTCPKWDFVGFYVDEGSTAPNMETAPEWSRLLQDCYDGKVDLVITQKASNISKKLSELAFCTRLLAALPHPVGIYFISEDIYTLASYYQEDLHDPVFFPSPDWKVLPEGQPQELHPKEETEKI